VVSEREGRKEKEREIEIETVFCKRKQERWKYIKNERRKGKGT